MSRRSTLSNRTVAALALSALAAGMVLQSLVAGHVEAPAPAHVTSLDVEPTGPGPWRFSGGIPSGFSHDEAGAIAAAASYTTTGQILIDLAPTQLPDAIRRYASTATAPEQIAQLTIDLAALRQRLAGGHGRTRYLKSVLATRLDSYSADRVSVRVWAVGVLWRSGAADPQADWTTSVFRLVWEDDSWKVETESITSGPTPAPNGGPPPVDASELDRLLDGFVAWGGGR